MAKKRKKLLNGLMIRNLNALKVEEFDPTKDRAMICGSEENDLNKKNF